jgi:hypothetical protein
MAATSRQNADSLKKELDQLKNKLKEEEKEKSRIPSPKEGKRGSSSQIHLGSTW